MQSVFVQDGMRRRRGKGVNSHFQVMIFGGGAEEMRTAAAAAAVAVAASSDAVCAAHAVSERERGSLPGL